jgi:DNA polymerase elongation subunit (family B)
MEPKEFARLRASQLNIVQLGIKVAANSAYGIFGLITWPFASPLIGNAITNAGKIYGIKLFQAVTVDILEQKEKLADLEKGV